MKKIFLFLVLTFCCSALLADSEKPTLWELVNSPIARKMAPQLNSVKMVFLYDAPKMPTSLMMVRANRTGEFRLDSLSQEASYAVGGNTAKVWCWDTDKGEHKLTDEELYELECDLAVLPVSFIKRDFFLNPVKEKEEKVAGVLCSCWRAADKSGKYKIRVWVDQKDSLLRKVESDFEGEIFTTFYEKYRVFNGIEIASVIRQTDSEGNAYKLELQTVQWNVKFAGKIFNLPKKGELLTLEREMRKFIRKQPKGTAEEVQKVEPKQNVIALKVDPPETRRAKLVKRIAKLEVEIQSLEERKSKATSSTPARITTSSSGGWYHRGFRRRGRSRSYGGGSRTRIDWQARSRQHEYEWVSSLLVQKKIELQNAKIDLAAMGK